MLNFPEGFRFIRRKSPLLYQFSKFLACSGPFYLTLVVHFQNKSPAAGGYYSILENNMVNTVNYSCKQKVIDKCCLCNSQIYHFMYCTGKTKMCKKLPIQGVVEFSGFRCRIWQEGEFRGLRPPSELCLHIQVIALYLVAKFRRPKSKITSTIRSIFNSELIPKISC